MLKNYAILIIVLVGFYSGCTDKTEKSTQEITPVLDSDYYTAVEPLIDSARISIEVMMFLISDTTEAFGGPGGLLAALSNAHSRGIDIRVLLNTIDINNQEAIEFLRTRGIPLRQGDRYSHTKLVIIDDAIVVVGSHNWTASAFSSNYEASILIRDEATALEYRNYFDDHFSVGTVP